MADMSRSCDRTHTLHPQATIPAAKRPKLIGTNSAIQDQVAMTDVAAMQLTGQLTGDQSMFKPFSASTMRSAG
jgi:hypothetical protein